MLISESKFHAETDEKSSTGRTENYPGVIAGKGATKRRAEAATKRQSTAILSTARNIDRIASFSSSTNYSGLVFGQLRSKRASPHAGKCLRLLSFYIGRSQGSMKR